MELSTTTRGKAKLLWNGYAYTKHIEKNGIIRWRCTWHVSTHCPSSVYTDLLPANLVLKTDHNHCLEPVKLEVIVTTMSYYQNVCYQDVLLQKHPITKMSSYQNVQLPKCPITKMSCYQNVHYQSILYPNVWIPCVYMYACVRAYEDILFLKIAFSME